MAAWQIASFLNDILFLMMTVQFLANGSAIAAAEVLLVDLAQG